MSEVNGAMVQRLVAREAGADGVARLLVERFLDPLRG
jgi:hypothetical protein